MKVPRPFDQLGVWFLSQKSVRNRLCKQAFAYPSRDVGVPEEQIASLHLDVPGWGRTLAAFARSGGVANYGTPVPKQPLHVLWGKQDRILQESIKRESKDLLGNKLEEIDDCGHLPHIDQASLVAARWVSLSKMK